MHLLHIVAVQAALFVVTVHGLFTPHVSDKPSGSYTTGIAFTSVLRA
jgi:hypothetical protein